MSRIGYEFSDLLFLEEPKIKPAPFSWRLFADEFYISGKAIKEKSSVPRDYYLHKDGLWHEGALPHGYFDGRSVAEVALAKAMRDESPARVNLDAQAALARSRKEAWRA